MPSRTSAERMMTPVSIAPAPLIHPTAPPYGPRFVRSMVRTKRGPYGGAVGWINGAGAMDTGVIIRSALVRDGVAHVRAGAGVVHDSDPLAEADAVAYRWLSMVLDIAGSHNGLVKEKYDVVSRSAEVPVEYGNQGADRGSLLASRSERTLGFAWTNASVLLLLEGLSPELREALDVGAPGEKLPGPKNIPGGGGEPLRAIG